MSAHFEFSLFEFIWFRDKCGSKTCTVRPAILALLWSMLWWCFSAIHDPSTVALWDGKISNEHPRIMSELVGQW